MALVVNLELSIVQRNAAVHSNVHVHECLNFLILALQCLGVDFAVDIQRPSGLFFYLNN
jgi:hypothetical protein